MKETVTIVTSSNKKKGTQTPMKNYKDFYYTSTDGLRLYARDYSHAIQKKSQTKTILCMHGLSRNSADFEGICEQLADKYRLIVVDQRGRGLSDYDPNPEHYTPFVYVEDMFQLLETLKLSSVILLGTSMGGIIAMMMAAMKPEQIEALIINDIGPDIATKGLNRLKQYVGKPALVTNWEEAAKRTAEINAIAFPDASKDDWLQFAKRLYHEDDTGRPVLAYDPNIAIPFKKVNSAEGKDESPDLWPVYEQIVDKPLLLIRGELSDIIDMACVKKMQQKKPDIEILHIPNVGHAPLLSEPDVAPRIIDFLQRMS